MKDILILGGFGWLGFALTESIIKNNLLSNIIIVDVLNNYLTKDNIIKSNFDNFAHLYDINIFLYNVNIKDKIRMEDIYKNHNIGYVVNNIKFNHLLSENDKKELLRGFVNIINLNKIFSVKKYVYLTRTYTHDKLLFASNVKDNTIEENFIFNENIYLINEHNSVLVNIPDYIFGSKCYSSNNVFYKIRSIFQTRSPLYVPQCSLFCLCDEVLLCIIFEALFTDLNNKHIHTVIDSNVCGPYRYIDIINRFKNVGNSKIIIEQTKDIEKLDELSRKIDETSLLGKYIQRLV